MVSLFVREVYASPPDQICLDWFRSGKLAPSTHNCELKCTSLSTGMGTFICPSQCEVLCKKTVGKSLLGHFVYYPGLTSAEKKLIQNKPKEAAIVFVQKTIAERATSRNFPDQGLNDESDAFRHFVWAGLLTKELGSVAAKEFLDAHESDPDQPQLERNMDLHNNELGQKAAQKLMNEGKWDVKHLESKALDELRSKELNVIKPGLPIPRELR